jgi:glycosyltransferase involved in cell wall biosynthesis
MSPAARILHVESNEDGTVGGSHQCLLDLARRIDRARFTPVAVFYQGNAFVSRLAEAGVEVYVWERERRRERVEIGAKLRSVRLAARIPGAVLRRAAILRRLGIRLVHLNNTPVAGGEDWLPAARILRLPIVSHCRALYPPGESRLHARLARGFDRIVAISDAVAESLARAGVPDARIVRIHDGIDIAALQARARKDPAETRSALGVASDEFLVVMVGHLRAWKGQHVLLHALADLPAADGERFRVAFAGAPDFLDPAYAASLRELTGRLGLERRVLFLGVRDDAPDLMRAGDVVVHASTSPEPFGLVVLEAMALGRPVVASRQGGPSEIVAEGTGILFDPSRPDELAAHLSALSRDAERRSRLGQAGKERARAFGIERNVGALEALYEALL